MSNARPKAGVKLRDDEKVKHIPVTIIPTEKEEMLRKPEWIKIKLPRTTDKIDHIKKTLRKNKLHSVCEEASCPNLAECFNHGTATFMILGDICTRRCPFCDVAHGKPLPPSAEEPEKLATTIAEMKLRYVVITSVDRDDLRDSLWGNRSRKVDADGFNAFDSPNFPPLLEAGINIRLKAGELATPSDKPLRVSPVKAQPIGMVSLYPGIASEVLKNTLQQPVNALILLSYGVGNAPQSPSLIAQLNYAKDREIPVLNCTQCIRGRVNMGGYATGHGLQQAGVLSGSDMTPEAALAKLHYLLSKSLSFSQLKSQLTHNLRGELSE